MENHVASFQLLMSSFAEETCSKVRGLKAEFLLLRSQSEIQAEELKAEMENLKSSFHLEVQGLKDEMKILKKEIESEKNGSATTAKQLKSPRLLKRPQIKLSQGKSAMGPLMMHSNYGFLIS